MVHPTFQPTAEQEAAIHTIGSSLIVSAAAGAGKTAVLAERCAYLVCDLSPDQRCDIDQLLVLTFTEAAAAQMRSRIADSIRRRLADRPNDERLRRQLALADVAQISTIHSFCLWLIRRWFSELDLDPTATVLDADEAELLKREELDRLLDELYATDSRPADPLGAEELKVGSRSSAESMAIPDHDWIPGRRPVPELGPAFLRLLEDYGLGDDRRITDFLLRLFEYTRSLPDPAQWLVESVRSLVRNPDHVLLSLAGELRAELRLQDEFVDQLAEVFEKGHSTWAHYAQQVRDYHRQLGCWLKDLGSAAHGSLPLADASHEVTAALASNESREGAATLLERFERVREHIAGFEFDRRSGPRLPRDTDPDVRAQRDQVSKTVSTVIKKQLFSERLRNRFGLFSLEEWREGLQRVAPFVATLADLIWTFAQRYSRQKRRLNVLDFADLERFAFDLLRDRADGQPDNASFTPSDVARALHARFRYVLVDEFQDVNPLQEAMLRLTSHEADPCRPNNLFAVGDVKQSIYRFRLAEPEVFLRRLRRSRHSPADGVSAIVPAAEEMTLEPSFADSTSSVEGEGQGADSVAEFRAVYLQHNFRSRPTILEAVNLVFRRLMRSESCGIDYDARAELRPGPSSPPTESPDRVEVHVLQRRPRSKLDSEETDDPNGADSRDEEPYDGVSGKSFGSSEIDVLRLSSIEREACLIGRRIRELMDVQAGSGGHEPRRYQDFVVLLRAAKVNAERMASVFAAMGIPVYAEVGGSLLATQEVRGVLAALQVLDNLQQDIPLAAVMRNGMFGDQFSDDDLVEIRLLDRTISFHEVVRRYAREGKESGLRGRLDRWLAVVRHYREAARRRPLAEIIWQLYEQQGYLARETARPNGAQRKANLVKLHDLARRFGSFRRQGLSRFLRFVESLEGQERSLDVAAALGESENVVRIMSIHQSKGLEFPVVFVAGLGARFNLEDRAGRMIFERRARIGLRVVDPVQMIEYPTAVHHLASWEIERNTRAEEMRILYVAMTRAKEKLVLVGSTENIEHYRSRGTISAMAAAKATSLTILTARNPLDWIMAALQSADSGAVRSSGKPPPDGRSTEPLFDVCFHDAGEIARWSVAAPGRGSQKAVLDAIAHLGLLPDDEPIDNKDPRVTEVRARLDFVYPFLGVSSLPATMAASELRSAYRNEEDEMDVDPPANVHSRRGTDFDIPPSKYAAESADDAARRGVITHRVLQHLDFAAAYDEVGLATEIDRLLATGVITDDERRSIPQGDLAWFLTTPLAGSIRKAGPLYHREFPFIAAEPPGLFDASIASSADDRVLVRGIIDGILEKQEGLVIIDFKTDQVNVHCLAQHSERYKSQLFLYSRAVSRLWKRPATEAYLIFLAAHQIVSFPAAELGMDLGRMGEGPASFSG